MFRNLWSLSPLSHPNGAHGSAWLSQATSTVNITVTDSHLLAKPRSGVLASSRSGSARRGASKSHGLATPDLDLPSFSVLDLREFPGSGSASRGASKTHGLATPDLDLPSFSILDTREFPRSEKS